MALRRVLCLLTLFGCACDGAPATPDAGGGEDAGAGPMVTVTPPAPAALPVLTPCPEGWVPVFDSAGAPECDPLPEDPGLCSLGVVVPGAGCVALPGCPGDGWPAALPDDAVYVDAAATGGDGSRDAPFSTVGDALGAAAAGGTIALRTGSHTVNATVRDVTLRGACADTTLTSDTPAAAPLDAVLTLEGTATVEDLSIRGAPRAGLAVAEGAEAVVRRVAILAVAGFGVGVLGRLTAEDLAIDGVRGGVLGGGRGITVEGEGEATLRRASITDTSEVGAFSSGALVMEDTAVLGDWNPEFGLVFDSVPGLAAEGGSITLRRGLLASHTGAAARATASGALTLEDVVIRDNREEGLRLTSGGGATLTRCAIGPGHPWGVLAIDAGTRFEAAHLLLTGAFVRGISAARGAQVDLDHALVADGVGGGVQVDGADGQLIARDLTVRDIDSDRPNGGRGLGVQNGATADLERIDVARVRGLAVAFFGDGGPHRLVDASLRETRSERDDGSGGAGLGAFGEGVALTVERAWLSENRGTAVVVDRGARVSAEDLRVEDTRPQDCAAVSCPDEPGGTGVGVYRGGSLNGEDFAIAGSPLCGLQIAEGGALDLENGSVSDGLIGACVQVEDFDVGRIERGVSYLRNERNLDSAARSIPASQLPATPQDPVSRRALAPSDHADAL